MAITTRWRRYTLTIMGPYAIIRAQAPVAQRIERQTSNLMVGGRLATLGQVLECQAEVEGEKRDKAQVPWEELGQHGLVQSRSSASAVAADCRSRETWPFFGSDFGADAFCMQDEGVEKWGLGGYGPRLARFVDCLWAGDDLHMPLPRTAGGQCAACLLPRGRSWRASEVTRRTFPWA